MNDFDDLSDLDEVFGPLRSAATPAELSQERAVVERMVKVRRTTEGKHMFTSRRARVATLVAAGVLGFGGMAAASPSLLGDQPVDPEPVVQPEPVVEDDVVVEDQTVEPEPVQPEVVEPVELAPVDEVESTPEANEVEVIAPSAVEPKQERFDVPLVDDPSTAFIETDCLPGNHGATVSAVARGEFPDGVSVRDAAHSSCGKTPKVDSDDPEIDAEPEPEDETEDDAEDATQTEAKPAKPAKEGPGRDKGTASNGNSSEKSNGNGKGNGTGAPGKRGD